MMRRHVAPAQYLHPQLCGERPMQESLSPLISRVISRERSVLRAPRDRVPAQPHSHTHQLTIELASREVLPFLSPACSGEIIKPAKAHAQFPAARVKRKEQRAD